MTVPPADLAAALARGDELRLATRDANAGRRANLPIRYWRQQAHLTAPATDPVVARKALEGGTAPMSKILDKVGLQPADLAERLEVPIERVEKLLAYPERAPAVVLDGEDAIAPGEAAAARAVEAAASVFAEEVPKGYGPPPLRFYRPGGLKLETTVRDLYTLLWRLRNRMAVDDPAQFPLDGIVMPKIEHPDEVDLVNELLDRAEADLRLTPGQIRVAYLIESGWAAVQLPEIAGRAAPRLAALIFGAVDFSADLGLPTVDNHHPVADWARSHVIAVAGAVGVPALDGMTLDYPVLDPSRSTAVNRVRWLDRMRLCYDDATRARELGMQGKWVGHPAQLFAALLAFGAKATAEAEASLQAEMAKLEVYDTAVAADKGVAMIAGVMTDRATSRHAMVVLRKAAALGRLDPNRALALGVIAKEEFADVELVYRANRARSTALGAENP